MSATLTITDHGTVVLTREYPGVHRAPADHAHTALRQWADEHGYMLTRTDVATPPPTCNMHYEYVCSHIDGYSTSATHIAAVIHQS